MKTTYFPYVRLNDIRVEIRKAQEETPINKDVKGLFLTRPLKENNINKVRTVILNKLKT